MIGIVACKSVQTSLQLCGSLITLLPLWNTTCRPHESLKNDVISSQNIDRLGLRLSSTWYAISVRKHLFITQATCKPPTFNLNTNKSGFGFPQEFLWFISSPFPTLVFTTVINVQATYYIKSVVSIQVHFPKSHLAHQQCPVTTNLGKLSHRTKSLVIVYPPYWNMTANFAVHRSKLCSSQELFPASSIWMLKFCYLPN